uniref:Uncharacterized protein n=1 Tax=Anguilla anguilla TaxID=7936 RepID=A0A0E9WBA2_ANGAN
MEGGSPMYYEPLPLTPCVLHYIHYRHLAAALMQSGLHNFYRAFTLHPFTAGYILKQCRLSTLLKGTQESNL